MPTSIRDQIAAKRAEALSARNSPASSPRATTSTGSRASGFASPTPARRQPQQFHSPHARRTYPQHDELLEETNVPGQVAKARRSGKLDVSSMSLDAIPPLVYTDLLGIPEDELSTPPAKVVEEARPRAPGDGQTFEQRLAHLEIGGQQDEDARNAAFSTPPPKRRWTEPEELTSLKAHDNRIERLDLEIGQFGGLKTLDLRGNRLESLPDAVADLLRLTWIDLSNNSFTAIPPALLLLPELETINLSNNAIDTIDLTSPVKPSDVGLAYGTGFLVTSFERQARAPKTVLSSLRSLNLSQNVLNVAALSGLAGKGQIPIQLLNLSQNNLGGVLDAEAAGIDARRMPQLMSLILGGNKHLSGLKGDIAAGCAVDHEDCAWGAAGSAAASLGMSPRKAQASPTPPDAAAKPVYTPAPGGPNDVPNPTLTIPFVTHPAASFDSDPLPVEMDVYLPPSSTPLEPHPVIIWWHGGGLLQGNKENLPPHLRRLPARSVNGGESCIVVSPNYRLAPQAPIIDILADADAAVNFVRTKLNDILVAKGSSARVDSSRVILSGGSAGGYLAMIVGLPTPKSVPDAEVGGHRGPQGWTPIGIAPFYPITDLEHVFWATETDPVPWWGESVPHAAAKPHLNHRDPPVAYAVSGGPRSILYPYMLQHGLFPNLLFYNQRSRGNGLDGYRPSPGSMGVTTRLKLLKKYDAPRPPIYMCYGTIDDKVQPLEETCELLRETKGDTVIEVIEGADHAFDENPDEQCAGFEKWLEGVLQGSPTSR